MSILLTILRLSFACMVAAILHRKKQRGIQVLHLTQKRHTHRKRGRTIFDQEEPSSRATDESKTWRPSFYKTTQVSNSVRERRGWREFVMGRRELLQIHGPPREKWAPSRHGPKWPSSPPSTLQIVFVVPEITGTRLRVKIRVGSRLRPTASAVLAGRHSFWRPETAHMISDHIYNTPLLFSSTSI